MLGDAEVMYAWEHSFTDEEVIAWIERRLKGYSDNGYDYMLATCIETGKVIGQIGLLKENILGKNYIGVGYILNKAYWGKGYATEGARACIDYAFEKLFATEVVADIRPHNKRSIAVALRLGMKKIGQYEKPYKGKAMLHDVYVQKNPKFDKPLVK